MNIRTRIFLVFATAIIAGFSLLAYWISSDVGDRYSESFEEVMVDTANLLAEIITTDMNAGARTSTGGSRQTLIDWTGTKSFGISIPRRRTGSGSGT